MAEILLNDVINDIKNIMENYKDDKELKILHQKKIDQALKQLTKYVNAEGEIVDSQFVNVKELRAIIAAMKDLKDIVKVDTGNDMRKLDEVLGKIEGNI